MVSILSIYLAFLRFVMKMIGMSPVSIETEPGTVMHFWAPTELIRNHPNHRKPSKPAVVFLHGFALNGILNWQFQVLAFTKDYAIYVPDFLFFGDSITDKPDRSPSFQGECVTKGLRKLGVEKCTLVGHSYGGMVGFKMAEMYPEMVESMVITCSVMAMTESMARARLDSIGFASWADCLLPNTVQGLKTMFEIGTYKFPWMPNFVYKQILEGGFDNRKERTELLDALIVKNKDFTVPSYPQVRGRFKIHLLWGQNDKIFNMGVALDMKELIGDKASLCSIEKTGHMVFMERPFVYNSHLKRILASLYVHK